MRPTQITIATAMTVCLISTPVDFPANLRSGLRRSSPVMDGAIRNKHLAAVEPSEHEAVEALAVSAAVIRKQPNCDRLSELEAFHAVGAEMHTGGIASERDIARKLVDLGAQHERLAAPGLEPAPVCGGQIGRAHV